MNAGEKRAIKIGFPFGLYLKQLFSTDTYVRYINPFSFWRRYKIDYLKTCLDARSLASYADAGSHRCHELDTVQYLENCLQLEYQVRKQTNIDSGIDYTDVSINSLLRQAQLNTIYISQPLIKLKYRGVSYYTMDILNVKIHIVEIDPSIASSNSLKYTNNPNNPSTSEKSNSDR